MFFILILHIGVLTVTRPEILQGVRDVESSPSSERVAIARGHNDQGYVCYGVGVDAKREHQSVCEDTSACESV